MNYTDDITSPLDAFRDHFREENARAAEAVLDELIRLSGIDAEANKSLCDVIHALENEIRHEDSKRTTGKLLRACLILISLVCAAVPLFGILHLIFPDDIPDVGLPWYAHLVAAMISAAGFRYVFAKLNPGIRAMTEHLKQLKLERDGHVATAWKQMRPLNELFDWCTVAEVVRRTIPNLVLDDYFTRERLNDLKNVFGWSDDFNRDKSILFCHSGDLNGNPFVLGESLNYRMGTKTYTGSLHISWVETETYTDSQGHTRTRQVTKHETLYASVDKPCPEYSDEKFLIYGNEAAPDLSFSRSPTGLADGSLFDGVRLKWRMDSQRKRARKDIKYTVMSNRIFEGLFCADDRDDEIQFRLLFTPLAQQETVKLLRDNSVGYGDDFVFRKSRRINMIVPSHLRRFDITASPDRFVHFELEKIRSSFLSYNAEFFRAFYFALAPLLAIPLYQQTPPPRFGTVYGKKPGSASFWECESLANSFDEDVFRHPASITRNILKTSSTVNPDGDTVVSVTACGFRGEPRTDYISKYGGDGYWHDVPVHWTEYFPVQRTSPFVIRESGEPCRRVFDREKTGTDEWRKVFTRWGKSPADVSFRRGILFWKNK